MVDDEVNARVCAEYEFGFVPTHVDIQDFLQQTLLILIFPYFNVSIANAFDISNEMRCLTSNEHEYIHR